MSRQVSLTQRAWDSLQFFLCLGVVGLLLVYLTLGFGHGDSSREDAGTTEQVSDVQVIDPRCIAIRPNSPIYQKLHIATIKQAETTTPIVTVTGVDVASLQPKQIPDGMDDDSGGADQLNDFQFHSLELLTAFTDWQKAVADIDFAEKQLQLIEQHHATTIEAHKQKVDLLEEEVKGGTEAKKSLTEALSELRQAEIEGQKEIHEAQTAIRLAQRDKTTFAKQLELEGLLPELLVSASTDVDIVMAEVPESMIKHVRVGQSCVAKFFSHPDKKFYGKVLTIVPVLSKELRSLRVLFAIEDAGDLLHPGMFAEIGLGIDPRVVLQVSPESIVHIGESDYVLVRKNDSDWAVMEVQIGELHESGVEVFSGLNDGDQVAGKGVILLKSVIAESLRLK